MKYSTNVIDVNSIIHYLLQAPHYHLKKNLLSLPVMRPESTNISTICLQSGCNTKVLFFLRAKLKFPSG